MSRRPLVRPEPLEVDSVRVVAVGTALWGLALLGCLVLRDWLVETGREWWTWTCVTGLALGLFGIWVCRRHEARARAADREEAERR